MMAQFALIAVGMSVSWHLVPLAVVISLVYSASRYELPERILRRSIRLFTTIVAFMVIVFAILWALSFKL